MATGSRRIFQYTADDGSLYALSLDESTYENAGLGFGAITPNDPNYNGLAKASQSTPVAFRYFNMVGTDADGVQVKRRVFVGDPLAAAWTDPQSFQLTLLTVVGNTATPTVFTVSSAIGEKRQFVPNNDSGLLDGDTDSNVAVGP